MCQAPLYIRQYAKVYIYFSKQEFKAATHKAYLTILFQEYKEA